MTKRVLRFSIYEDPFHPITFVTRECDLQVPLERAATDLEELHSEVFVVTEIFEVPEDQYDDEIGIIHLGLQRLQDSARELEERNMAISFYWNAAQLRSLNPGGVLVNPSRAPLTVAQLKVIQRQLVRHPNYRNQIIHMTSRDGEEVTVKP